MAQPKFKDPIVSAGPTLTGTGNGTLAVDKLTHFTTAQDYTLTCIAKSPDTLFSVVGSLDGPVGIAKAGTQFFDDDLKIFLTIQQGATPFEVGDKFELTVVNGTDLHQDNIDDYDELPQKNFGVGTKGFLSGDNNLRFSEDDVFAELLLQSLKFTSIVAGDVGNDTQIQYFAPLPAIAAAATLQDLHFIADTGGVAGNSITVNYLQYIAANKAALPVQDLTYRAVLAGTAGNAISIAYTTGAIAGAEVVTVVGNAISVQIESGVSTAFQIKAAVVASIAASALVDVSPTIAPAIAQTAPFGPSFLTGGSNAVGDAGNEVVSVIGNAITVRLESGVSTAIQVKAKLDASSPAAALINTTITGVGSNPQTAPAGPQGLSGGVDAVGLVSPAIVVVSTLIKAYFVSGGVDATTLKAAFDGSAPASALVSTAIVGPASDYQFSPVSATNLAGGESKYFSFNKHELTESGDFSEGNASVRMQDAQIQGHASIQKNAEISGKVTLKDSGSDVVADVQQYINWLMQDQKVSLRTSDHSKLQWSKPDLTIEADIVIDFNDTDHFNKISVSESPISIPDGESLYVILDRSHDVYVTPLVAATIPRSINAFRIASRFGDNIILWDNTLVRDGKAVRIGEGGEGGTVRVDLYDPVSTILPSGATATLDGVAVTNNMLVLFSNLTSGSNRIYKAAGVGTSITWVAQSSWSTGLDPVLADDVIVAQGTAFGLQHGIFDGADFQFNDTVRYFNGTDFWEVSSLKSLAMVASTTADIFTINVANSENIIVDYSIIRGARKETGTLHITSDGTSAVLTTSGAYLGDCGVVFQATIVTGVLHVKYVADGSAGTPSMKYYVRRWSDSAGGPTGIPSYTSTGSGFTAAGSNTQIQFNDSGALGADADFTWDKSNNILSLAGLQLSGLSAAIVLNDAVVSPTDIIIYNATNYPFAIIEYSLQRDGVYECGRLMIATDGTTATISADFVSAGGSSGITFLASVSAGNVHIQYLSTSTTFNASFKYAARRWS